MFSHLGPISSDLWPPLGDNPRAYAGLATSFAEDVHYRPPIEGKVPEGLRGTLYRNGPGLFDRDGRRKRMILDGDGLAESFRFDGDGVDFTARFIRTPKFIDEEKAGRFLYPTWSTLSPAGWWRNIGARIKGQAGVTIVDWAGRLLAFDEAQKPVELDPATLSTRGEIDLVPGRDELVFQAHWKWGARSQEWIPLVIRYGKTMTAEAFFFDPKGQSTGSRKVELPRAVYIHDWFVTENHLVFLLHPGFVPLGSYLKLLAGMGTFAEIVRWKPSEGNVIAVVPKRGHDPVRLFETEALWMWHSANAYERGKEIVLDFVGSADGGGIGQGDSGFYQIMSGQAPTIPAEPSSLLYRYVLDLQNRTSRREVLADGRNFEMPFLDPTVRAVAHRYVYLAQSDLDQLFWSSVVRQDTATGKREAFHFGEQAFCTEPVFASARTGREGDGWLLTVVYEHARRQSHLAVLDASRLADGPIARVRLRHALPLSFHGCFSPA